MQMKIQAVRPSQHERLGLDVYALSYSLIHFVSDYETNALNFERGMQANDI